MWPFKKKINLRHPKPFDKVSNTFVIAGDVPLSWFSNDQISNSFSISFDLISAHGKTMVKAYLTFFPQKNSLKPKDSLPIYAAIDLNQYSDGFIKQSEGHIAIRLSGHGKNQSITIPIIVKELVPEEGANPQIINKQATIEKRIAQYKEDSQKYAQALGEIMNSRRAEFEKIKNNTSSECIMIAEDKILDGIYEILESANDNEVEELEKKYKDALEWSGPLVGGLVARLNGFMMVVYSNDHDKHFHVIHREKGINARISFPEIKLLNYVSKNTMTSKTINSIRDFVLNPEIFSKFEKEFEKRQTTNSNL